MGTNVLIKKREKISFITLNMPGKMNALGKELREDFIVALKVFRDDDESTVAVITGEGNAFCAGGNIEELRSGITPTRALLHMSEHNNIILSIAELTKPVIAAVNGAAVGAGFSLALACDMIVASTNAIFSQAFTKVGLVPDMGSLYFLPRAVGIHRAKELIFTGKTIKAEEAKNIGIVNEVVVPEELEACVLDLAKKISDGPTFAFAMEKAILSRSLESSLRDMLDYEAYAQSICIQTSDHKEGIEAFYEKRNPIFKGK